MLNGRWLILAIGSLSVVLFELFEHQDSIDFHFWRETFVYGLIAPIVAWLFLTRMAQNMNRRAKSDDYLERYRLFIQQLEQNQEWDELTRFVTKFPATVLPIEHASLYIYDHSNAKLEFVSGWNASTSGTIASDGRYRSYNICSTCLLTRMDGVRHTPLCALQPGANVEQLANEYCVPLSYQKLLVGVLRLRCRPGRKIPPDQIEFMDSIASRMALALVISIAQPRKMEEARAEAQLDERRRIAYELHDSLAQQLGYLHLSLDRLAGHERLVGIDEVRQELEFGRTAAKDAYEQTRGLLSILRSWDTVDLTQMIEEEARLVIQRTDLKIDVLPQGNPVPLSPIVCQQIFSLVREGLTNVERHAQARGVQIILHWSADGLSIDVRDDGIGFDPAAVPQGHYGLIMIRERIRALDGEIGVESERGKGTRMTLWVPLARARTMAGDPVAALSRS